GRGDAVRRRDPDPAWRRGVRRRTPRGGSAPRRGPGHHPTRGGHRKGGRHTSGEFRDSSPAPGRSSRHATSGATTLIKAAPPCGRSAKGQPVETLGLARWQFGITTVYHFILVPLTIGLAP